MLLIPETIAKAEVVEYVLYIYPCTVLIGSGYFLSQITVVGYFGAEAFTGDTLTTMASKLLFLLCIYLVILSLHIHQVSK